MTTKYIYLYIYINRKNSKPKPMHTQKKKSGTWGNKWGCHT